MVEKMTKEQRIRRHLARMQSQRASKAFCAWRDHVRLSNLQKSFLSQFTPLVSEAFRLPPSHRVRQHIDEIYRLLQCKNFPWARALPEAALRHACRHMTYEVLHDDMVVPRGPEDCTNFFAVFYGAPVQVAYGTLGASILSQALDLTQTQQSSGSNHAASKHGSVDSAELIHFDSDLSSVDPKTADSIELAWRRRAHAYLRPACLDSSWGSNIRPTATTSAAALPFNKHSSSDANTPPERDVQQDMQGLSPGAAGASRSQTPLQHALLGCGEAFTGTALKGWTTQVTAWPSPIQAHVARSSPGLFSVVLILPGEVVSVLVEAVAQQHLRQTVDLCLRVPAFRHLTVSVLAGLAQYCEESHVPSRHELLRQGHSISHIFLLLSGSVDVTAFVPAPDLDLDPLQPQCRQHGSHLRGFNSPASNLEGLKSESETSGERDPSHV